MKTVLVTGAAGFIGENLCNLLSNDYKVTTFNRNNSEQDLEELIAKADYIFHLAAVMRPKDSQEFSEVNIQLTKKILSLVVDSGRNIPFLLTSSIQAENESDYGFSKNSSENLVLEWASKHGGRSYIFRLPNVFGPLSKPNYTSVVATFCYNISHNLPIELRQPDSVVKLAYIDDVLDEMISTIVESEEDKHVLQKYYYISRVFDMNVKTIAKKICDIHDKKIQPPFTGTTKDFDNFLYITYTYFKELE